jgi:hypothetical protein
MAFVRSDGHRVTALFHQLNARQTWHETDDTHVELAEIIERMLHVLDVASDFALSFKPNRHGHSLTWA